MGKAQFHDHLPLGDIDDAINQEVERREIEHKIESYQVRSFTERSDPEGAFRAQQIQGESYNASGYVYDTGLDEYGRLLPELDRSRGDEFTYMMATSIDGSKQDQAAMRTTTAAAVGGLDNIAAFQYSKDSLYAGSREYMEDRITQYGQENFLELAALSRSNEAQPLAVFELIRGALQAAVRDNTNEVWLMTLTSPVYDTMKNSFGPRSLPQLGEPVAVDVGDSRTSESLRVIPTIIRPCDAMDDILADMNDVSQDSKEFMRYARSLVFLADGMKESELSPAVFEKVKPFI